MITDLLWSGIAFYTKTFYAAKTFVILPEIYNGQGLNFANEGDRYLNELLKMLPKTEIYNFSVGIYIRLS